MNIDEVKKWLKEHLTLEVREEGYGFNGRHTVIRLKIDEDVISEEYIDISRDEG